MKHAPVTTTRAAFRPGTGGLSRGAADPGRRRRNGSPNWRLVKFYRNYLVEEVAKLLGIHKQTVRNWIKEGLRTCDNGKPTLIVGRHLVAFLKGRRGKRKKPCGPDEIYCVRCRTPRVPAGQMADYRPLTPTSGNLEALCPACGSLIYRRTNLARLEQIRAILEVQITQATSHVDERPEPSVICDFEQEKEK